MVVAQHVQKSCWQKFYSFLGFWTYLTHDNRYQCTRTLYWICLPWSPFYRKFDLFSWDTSETQSIAAKEKIIERHARREFVSYGIEL